MLTDVPLTTRDVGAFAPFGRELLESLQKTARDLRGTRIWHVNTTARGGGVAELLQSEVPLERSLGLDAHWFILRADPDFFRVTKKLHNLLQGGDGTLTDDERQRYERESERLADALAKRAAADPPELLIAHDPQPALACGRLPLAAPKILRLHVDLCAPNPDTIPWLCAIAPLYAHLIVSRRDCILPCFPPTGTTAILPAIDPFAPKSTPLPRTEAQRLLIGHGVDPARPLIAQVSRFDQWKDPLGVVAAFRRAKARIPGLQLALVGFFETPDDPEAGEVSADVRAAVGDDPDVHLFTDVSALRGTPVDTFVNAVQVASDVIVQKSLREGFGLTVTEAMWKGKAVIGGDAGGILLQIRDGETGLIVHTVEEAADAIVRLLQSPDLRARLGTNARQSVLDHFLFPRFLHENLLMYRKVLGRG